MTIDHAAEARMGLATVAEALEKIGDRTDIPIELAASLNRSMARDLAAAQVHAQLALVEAQREANLIALAGVPTGMLTGAQREALGGFFARSNPSWEGDPR